MATDDQTTADLGSARGGAPKRRLRWPFWFVSLAIVAVCGIIVTARDVHLAMKLIALLCGAVLLAAMWMWCSSAGRVTKVAVLAGLALVAIGAWKVRTQVRYRNAPEMRVLVREFSNAEYPEDPADRSPQHGRYSGRELTLIQKDETHFDFVFVPKRPHVAQVVFRDVDVSLMTPSLPEWTKFDPGLRRIALTDRQWNRQQVRFDVASPQIEVSGGDGFEKQHLVSVELAKNCLNAGLWEVLLFVQEDGAKKLLYQGWFTFPLGHYQRLFERNTGLKYADHWYYLEHWFDPAETLIDLSKLREVRSEQEAVTTFNSDERVFASGEQVRKRRTTMATNVVNWRHFFDGHEVSFAAFIPPGRYSVGHPWPVKFPQMDRFEKCLVREIVSPGSSELLLELELRFTSSRTPGTRRFFISGVDPKKIPRLPIANYDKGIYMPMGIGVPPFFQTYANLQSSPPFRSPYFSLLLDDDDRWIDHHSFGIDGPILHHDEHDPGRLHLYLLSYERHSLIAHLMIDLDSKN